MAAKTIDIALDGKGIDDASEAIGIFLRDSTKLDRRSAVSARLTFESALINLSEHFGPDTLAELVIGNRLGKPRLTVKVRGERYDPRERVGESDWEQALMETAGLRPTYTYRGGHNIISLSCPRPPMGSTLKAFVAIACGVLIAQTGMQLPDQTRAALLEGIVTPLFDTYVGMLAGVAGPMVFCSVAWGICGIGDIAALGRSGKRLIGRFMGANVLATLFALAVCVPIFRLAGGVAAMEGNPLASITVLLLGLLPTNMVAPFLDGNTLQIITLSVAVGIAALALGDQAEGVRMALRQLNALVQFLMEQLCRLLPAFIVVMIVSQTWSGTLGMLLSSWLPVLVIACANVAFMLIEYAKVAFRCHISPVCLVKVTLPALLLSFTTASSSAAFGTMLSICKEDLGVDDEQVSFGMPLGMVLCKPMMPIVLMAILLYSAQSYGVGADLLWYVRLAVTCLLYSVAVPPVPGGMLACYGIMLTSLGIPLGALPVVTALDLLADNLSTSGDVGGVMVETLVAADALGAVDRDRLGKLGA